MNPEIAKMKEIYDALVAQAPPPQGKEDDVWTFALYMIAIMNAGTTTPA